MAYIAAAGLGLGVNFQVSLKQTRDDTQITLHMKYIIHKNLAFSIWQTSADSG